MNAQECVKYIVKELHTVVFSTVGEKGYPVTCAIDMIDGDESSLYFLTARGKQFYSRLKANRHIAFTALRGKDTLSSIAVSVQGEAKELDSGRESALPEPFPWNRKFSFAIKPRQLWTFRCRRR